MPCVYCCRWTYWPIWTEVYGRTWPYNHITPAHRNSWFYAYFVDDNLCLWYIVCLDCWWRTEGQFVNRYDIPRRWAGDLHTNTPVSSDGES